MSYIGNTSTTQAFTPAVDYFSGNASTTAFTLSRPVASVAQVQVTVANVPQNPTSAYTISGQTLTFTSAPPSGTNNIYVYYTSPITQTFAPAQGSVNTTSFASSTGTGAGVFQTSPTINTPTLTSPVITGSTPQVTVYTSGSGTYTTPTNCRYLFVRMIGGGGGGGGTGSSGASNGGTGGTTTFGSSFLTCNGGGGGNLGNTSTFGGNPSNGGTATGGDINCQGGVPAQTPSINATSVGNITNTFGQQGANTIFGSGGNGGSNGGGSGSQASVNSGAGGGGGGGGSSIYSACSGSAGGYLEKTISSPSATYSYSVGVAGTAGTAGTSGGAGGAGGSGIIYITAYF